MDTCLPIYLFPCLQALAYRLRHFFFRRKLDHQLPAAKRHALLVERVKRLLAFASRFYQAGLTQNGEMVRDGGLGYVGLLDDLIDRERVATT